MKTHKSAAAAAGMVGLLLGALGWGCARHANQHTHVLDPLSGGRGMERYANERYAEALRFMEASRFEQAEAQFAVVEKTAVSPSLRQLAQEGRRKAAAVIEGKR